MGIFIHAVPADSPAARAGLRPGDHILEYNGVDLCHATAEQAAFELAKPADNVTMLVQYNYQSEWFKLLLLLILLLFLFIYFLFIIIIIIFFFTL